MFWENGWEKEKDVERNKGKSEKGIYWLVIGRGGIMVTALE